MQEPKTLATFQFDPKKTGEILKEWIKGSGMSYTAVARETGISYDTISNSAAGRVKEISLERVFKVGVATGHGVDEYIRLMLADEDITFSDRVSVLSGNAQAVQGHVYDATSVAAHAEAFAELEQEATESGAIDPGILNRFRDLYAAMIEEMHAHNASERKVAEESHKVALEAKADLIEWQQRRIKALSRKSGILGVLLGIETLFIAAILAIDVLNPSRGWILRSIINYGGSAGIMKG